MSGAPGWLPYVPVVGAMAAVVALVYRHRANKSNEQRNATAVSALENSIRDQLNKSRDKVEDFELQITNARNGRPIAKLEYADIQKIESIVNLSKSAHERWLNVYEDACSKYLTGQITKKWFREDLADEIKNLIEKPKEDDIFIRPFLHPRNNSLYNKIWAAYDELIGNSPSKLHI